MAQAPDARKAHARVSVIIPCYRQAHFLGDAIEGLLAQEMKADEIVVVDDGSPDDVQRVAARYPEVRCVTQENSGLPAARNRGLRECDGEYVVFLDADDRLLPEAIAAGVSALESDPDCAFVWGFNRPIDAEGTVIGKISNPFSGDPSYTRLLENNIVGPPVGVMYRRGAVLQAGGFSPVPGRAEDYDLYLRLARTHPFHCHGNLIAEYRYHDANRSGNHALMLKAVLILLEREADWIGTDAALGAALERGRKDARLRYDLAPRIDALADEVRAGRWLRGLASSSTLLLEYRSAFVSLVLDRFRRRLGSRRSASD